MRTGRPAWISFSAAFLAGLGVLAAADFVQVLLREPTLLGFGRLGALAALAASSAFLYVLMGFLVLPFSLLHYVAARLLRARVGGRALALASFLSFAAFFVVLRAIQGRMLGTYTSVLDPLFAVPIAVSAALLVVWLFVWAWAACRGVSAGPLARSKLALALTLLAGFVVFGLAFSRPVNVLGVFEEEEKRSTTREHQPDSSVIPGEDLPNIVVVVIECFRSDHFTPENAPFIWKLADDNVVFTRYYVAAPATRPSITSFFTSLYPVEHGCYNVAGGKTAGGIPMMRKVPGAAVSFPRLLQDEGYRTVMISSNSLTADEAFGFERVYQKFDAAHPYKFTVPYVEPFLGFRFLRHHLDYFRIFKMIAFSPEHSTTYFDGNRLNETIRKELDAEDDRPIFMYVHYMEPHAPYYRHPYRPFQLNLYLPGFRDDILANYASEITAADGMVRDLFTILKRRGVLDDTMVFITSDHGEEFYDHGDWGHGKSVYPEVLHVPAVLVLPAGSRRALEVDVPVESIDMAPTFMDLTGLESPQSWEGKSLLPLIEPAAAGAPAGSSKQRHRALAQFDDGQTLFATVIEDTFQLVMEARGGRERFSLFDLIVDPMAKEDLSGKGLEAEERMRTYLAQKLRELFAKGELLQSSDVEMDEDLIEQMRTLGYIE